MKMRDIFMTCAKTGKILELTGKKYVKLTLCS